MRVATPSADAVCVIMENLLRAAIRDVARAPRVGEACEEVGFIWGVSFRPGQDVDLFVPSEFYDATRGGLADWSVTSHIEDTTNSVRARQHGVHRVRLRIRLTVPVACDGAAAAGKGGP